MSDGRSSNPWFDERLSFTPEPGGPVDYASTADGPVQYVEVVDGQGTLGHPWFQDASDAADFLKLSAETAVPTGRLAPGSSSEAVGTGPAADLS
ncbi:hypothetical protein [Streptomyces sp. PsTaAH-124]|uniref:hypothetical protein n=1 Tax=Streptomyces sp. PsTaAH-124 TaxID=1157638 RepID=UPI00037ED9FF|nr:hypothetical protein [Streptomyces sp. PsTaAH-124]